MSPNPIGPERRFLPLSKMEQDNAETRSVTAGNASVSDGNSPEWRIGRPESRDLKTCVLV